VPPRLKIVHQFLPIQPIHYLRVVSPCTTQSSLRAEFRTPQAVLVLNTLSSHAPFVLNALLAHTSLVQDTPLAQTRLVLKSLLAHASLVLDSLLAHASFVQDALVSHVFGGLEFVIAIFLEKNVLAMEGLVLYLTPLIKRVVLDTPCALQRF
jgi:hypothetical protein